MLSGGTTSIAMRVRLPSRHLQLSLLSSTACNGGDDMRFLHLPAPATSLQTLCNSGSGRHLNAVWTQFEILSDLRTAGFDRKCFVLSWWPGTESNRRRKPFQGCQINRLQSTVLWFQRDMGIRFGLQLDARSPASIIGLHVDSRFAPCDSHVDPSPTLALHRLGISRASRDRRVWDFRTLRCCRPGRQLLFSYIGRSLSRAPGRSRSTTK